jgi:hypothetical protein
VNSQCVAVTACQLFLRSAEIAPDASASKWMYIAQTEEDALKSVEAYKRGVSLLTAARESLSGSLAAAVDDGVEVPCCLPPPPPLLAHLLCL